ncbi:MAG: hypothetical protein OHK0013_29750 [Sandaracinaceae bacterium]
MRSTSVPGPFPIVLALVASLAVACSGGGVAPATASETPRSTRNAGHGGSASPTTLLEPAVESAVASWVQAQAPGFSHVTLGAVPCGDVLVAVVWPFGRGGRIEDDDVVALAVRSIGGRPVIEGEPIQVRQRGDLLARCASSGRVLRGRRGASPSGIGSAFVERFSLLRTAVARGDARGIAAATLLVAELFDDDALFELPDVLADFVEQGVELYAAEARGSAFHLSFRERPGREVEEHDLPLVPTGELGQVMIAIPR